MCKARFDSQGIILNDFLQKKNILEKTLTACETPPPFMANAILNFHFDFPGTSLMQFGNNKNFPGVKEDFEQNTLVPLHFR